MAKLTMVVGVVLIVLGGAYFVGTGSVFPTSLIPTWFGLVLLLCGVLANTDDARKRMLWMHIAVTAGLLGMVGAAVRAGMVLAKKDGELSHVATVAVQEQLIMAAICAVFVGMCVRSFIAARREREASVQV